jgi:hypothetical protein
MWEARAEYADGTSFDKRFPSNATTYKEEQLEQAELESMLVDRHEGCIFYSVNWVDDN